MNGFAFVITADAASVARALNGAGLPDGTLVEPATTAPVPHVVARVPVAGRDAWLRARAALARVAAAQRWVVLTVAPRSEAGESDRRRARATALLPLATRLPSTRRLLDADELLVFQVLAATDPAARAAIVREVLGPVLGLPGSGGRRLLATLDALHWNQGSAKAAARSLGIHVKTVHNRLRRIEELTGLYLDHPPDRLRLDVALYLVRTVEAPTAATAGACA